MSNTALEKLFAAMKGSKGMPALESTVTSVLGLLNQPSSGHAEVAARIVEDFSLTQKVLRLANSSMYAPFAKDASSVSSAMEVLGSDALLHVALSTGMVTDLDEDENLAQTLLASELARSVNTERSEAVSIAALMFDLGRLMATRYLPEETAAIDQKIRAGATADLAASDVLGMSLSDIGVEIAKSWKLPASIVSIIDGTGDPTLVGVAKFSVAASSLIHAGKADEVQELVAKLDLPGIDTSKVAGLVQRKLSEVKRASKIAAKSSPEMQEAELNELLRTLQQTGWGNLEELASAMFTGFHKVLKTSHCLLFMLTRSGDFGIRFGHGAGLDVLKSKFRLTAEYQPTAFHAVIKNNVDVSIADVSNLKPTALPDGYTTLLPAVNKFIILPIANQRVSGLIYCDWESDAVVGQNDLAAIRKLRDLFLPHFPA
jgi:HD-like signal output (HDOD) protein